MNASKTALPPKERDGLLAKLRSRFAKHARRHPGLEWEAVESRLAAHPGSLWSLNEMERTGGEPDVVAPDPLTGACTFFDCSAESPSGRRSLCYDREAQDSRKEHRPESNVLDQASAMGVTLLTESQYRVLQQLGEFDLKTSSWVLTPPEIRHLGGALFCDRRYDTVFVYHNGAQSYYAARGFRAALKV